jgi:hypothetical protein
MPKVQSVKIVRPDKSTVVMPCRHVNEALSVLFITDQTSITHTPSGIAVCLIYGDWRDLAERLAKRFWNALPEDVRQLYRGVDTDAIVKQTPKWLIRWLRGCAKSRKCSPFPKVRDVQ